MNQDTLSKPPLDAPTNAGQNMLPLSTTAPMQNFTAKPLELSDAQKLAMQSAHLDALKTWCRVATRFGLDVGVATDFSRVEVKGWLVGVASSTSD